MLANMQCTQINTHTHTYRQLEQVIDSVCVYAACGKVHLQRPQMSVCVMGWGGGGVAYNNAILLLGAAGGKGPSTSMESLLIRSVSFGYIND